MMSIKQLINERIRTMEQDITNKIKAVKIVQKHFTPEGGHPIQYAQLVLEIVINGNVRQMPFKLNNDKQLVLESLPESDDAEFLRQSTINPINN